MAEQGVIKEGLIKSREGQQICYVMTIMPNLNCAACGRAIVDGLNDRMFYALGRPYCVLVHKDCLWNFQFGGEWPHTFPAAVYS